MDRRNFDRFYADNIGLIHAVARKGYGRLMGIGASIDYEDLVQELSETFIKAYDKFDEGAGAKFSTYFTFAAYNEINKIAERFERERNGSVVVSVEKKVGEYGYDVRRRYLHGGTMSIEEMGAGLEDETGIEDIIPADTPTPEDIVGATSLAAAIMSKLSPLAASIAGMAIDPPELIEREFIATQAYAEHARGNGEGRRCRSTLNITFVASVLEKTAGIPAGTIRAAKREIIEVTKENLL